MEMKCSEGEWCRPYDTLDLKGLLTGGVTDANLPPENIGMKSTTVAFGPEKDERKVLTSWMGTYRWTYNQCVSFSRRNPSIGGYSLMKALRATYVTSKALKEKGLLWVLKTPSEIRDRAVREFSSNLTTQKVLVKEKKR